MDHNAGVGMRDTVAEMEMSGCRELFDINCSAQFPACRL